MAEDLEEDFEEGEASDEMDAAPDGAAAVRTRRS